LCTADLRLAGGSVLLADGRIVQADLLVTGGRIAGILTPGSSAPAEQTVPLDGLTVLPGVVEPHLHLGHGSDISRPQVPADVDAETAAAAVGGVTSFIPYVLSTEEYGGIFEELKSTIEAGARIDFGMHFIMASEEQLARVAHYVDGLGVPTLKFFMSSRGTEGARIGLPHLDDGYLFRLLEKLHAAGGMLCPHPESIEVAWVLRDRAKKADPEGHGGLLSWNATSPPFVEAEGVRRVCYFARTLGTPVYLVHISSHEALLACRAARAEGGRIFVETCIHYLTLDTASDVGDRAKVNPPIREPADREALWRAVADGVVDTVGTDHVHRPFSLKEGGIWKASNGFPGMETLLPALLTEGCRRGISVPRLSDLVSRNPARIMGLGATKGQITVGADADFAIVDLNARWTMQREHVQSAAGFSVFEGKTMEARVIHTLVRGRFVLRDGELMADAVGTGRYLPRRLDPALTAPTPIA
jgi:dihydroorotase-like cyclic amidohydrolase